MMVNSLKPRLVTGNLKKKGFREDERHDHIWYVLYIDGKQTNIRTKVSHNSNDLGISLIKKMAAIGCFAFFQTALWRLCTALQDTSLCARQEIL